MSYGAADAPEHDKTSHSEHVVPRCKPSPTHMTRMKKNPFVILEALHMLELLPHTVQIVPTSPSAYNSKEKNNLSQSKMCAKAESGIVSRIPNHKQKKNRTGRQGPRLGRLNARIVRSVDGTEGNRPADPREIALDRGHRNVRHARQLRKKTICNHRPQTGPAPPADPRFRRHFLRSSKDRHSWTGHVCPCSRESGVHIPLVTLVRIG